MAYRHSVLIAVLGFLCAFAVAYEVPVEDAEYSRQICSGMWANQYTHINVSFDPTSQGHLAMVIYEWRDVAYLGKVTSETDEGLPVSALLSSSRTSTRLNLWEAENLRMYIERRHGWLLHKR
jgi:hypothetical protein